MTTFLELDVRCAVCGSKQRVLELTGAGAFGPPDLDLRPNGPQRWALPYTVHRCSGCGYCNHTLGEAPPGAEATVGSPVYREVLERSRLPSLARTLFCCALVHDAAGDPDTAGWRFLQAAWACDDIPEPAHARVCRDRAVEMFHRALQAGETGAPAGVVHTLIADLLRRARRFPEAEHAADHAAHELAELAADDGEHTWTLEIARYIGSLAATEDDSPHCCADAFTRDE